jgi:hypothetical protein
MTSKKLPLSIFLVFLVTLLSLSLVSADFPSMHIVNTLDALETQPNTAFKQICKENLRVCLAFNVCGADSTVVRYLTTEGREVYRGTHVKKAVDNCFIKAGSDRELQAACIGWGLHITQDPISHLDGGYTAKSIARYKVTNIIGHPPTERVMENYVLDNSNYDRAYIEELVSTNCDIFFEDTGTPRNKYLKLLHDASGLDLDYEVQIVQTALAGTGRYNSEQVWGKKVNLPNWWYYLTGGGLGLSLLAFLGIAIFSKRFKKTLMITWGIIGLIFGAVLLSLILGTSWIWYNSLVDVFGFFITIPDIDSYISNSFDATKQYLDSTGLGFTDATGLDHYVGNTFIPGALSSAESAGKILWWSIGIGFAVVLISLTVVSFIWKKKKR